MERANGRPVVALVNVAELDHAADVHATGVRFIYGKHPIMRTAHIRKLEVRKRWEARITEQESRARSAAATPSSAQSGGASWAIQRHAGVQLQPLRFLDQLALGWFDHHESALGADDTSPR